ncbi:hypothetical protein ACFQ4O_15515, partial [Methylopila musalis]
MTSSPETADWGPRARALTEKPLEGRAFIDGAYRPAADGAVFAAISPIDGRTLAEVSACTAADVDAALAAP